MTNFIAKWNALVDVLTSACENRKAAETAALCLVSGHMMLIESRGDISSLAAGVHSAIKDGTIKLVGRDDPSDISLNGTNVVLVRDLDRLLARQQCNIMTQACEREKSDGPIMVVAGVGENRGDMIPEAMFDRFAVCVSAELSRNFLVIADSVITSAEIMEMRREAQSVYMSDAIGSYLARLTYAFTHQPELIPADVKGYLSPARPHVRAMIHLRDLGRVMAVKNGRTFLAPEDIKPLLPDVVCHRFGIRQVYDRNRYEIGRTIARSVLENTNLLV